MRTGTADEVDETERLEREEATLPDIPPSRPATKELRRALQKVCRPRMQEQQSRPTVQHKGWACGCHTRGGGSRSECGLLRQVKAAPSKFQQRTAGTGRTRSYWCVLGVLRTSFFCFNNSDFASLNFSSRMCSFITCPQQTILPLFLNYVPFRVSHM